MTEKMEKIKGTIAKNAGFCFGALLCVSAVMVCAVSYRTGYRQGIGAVGSKLLDEDPNLYLQVYNVLRS